MSMKVCKITVRMRLKKIFSLTNGNIIILWDLSTILINSKEGHLEVLLVSMLYQIFLKIA